MTDAILDRFLGDLYNSNDSVKKSRSHYAKMWLEYAGESPWTRELVIAFRKHLKDEGFSEGTVRQVDSIVKRVFDAAAAVAIANQQKLIADIDPSDPGATITIIKALGAKIPTWDMGKRGAPPVRYRNTPTTSIENLTAIVNAALHDSFEPQEKAFLALASIYPLRRGELRRITPEDLHYDRHTIFLRTEKGGEEREQLLCDELVPVLQAYDFRRRYSDFDVSKMWHVIESKAGLAHEPDGGWHSLRRLVVTTLRRIWGNDSLQVKIFGHWRLASSPEITDRYVHEDPLEIDAQVLAKHPIVPLWRGAMRMDLGGEDGGIGNLKNATVGFDGHRLK
jgi:integrase